VWVNPGNLPYASTDEQFNLIRGEQDSTMQDESLEKDISEILQRDR
jgi:hypothetical protein